ncbi:MAG: anti-sigma regulatory factor [Verrucomicrobia bacterium]|nr:anti-sigma regulatory factor [Verrucomicrobiota bacterium]
MVNAETISVADSGDIVAVRQAVRRQAVSISLSLVDQTKIVTAASELARNMVLYGGGGEVTLELLEDGVRRGLRVQFTDSGPGIPDIDLAMRDGFTTGRGMGLGLGGAKRLVNEFEIESAPGKGTRVTIIRWR